MVVTLHTTMFLSERKITKSEHEQLTRKHEAWVEEKALTPKTVLLSWLGLFNWKLMVVVIATIQAASTVITSRGARIFCMTRKIDSKIFPVNERISHPHVTKVKKSC